MSFFEEWKKLIICVTLFILFFAIQYLTGADFSAPIKTLLDIVMGMLGVGAVKFSILSTSERKAIQENLPEKKHEDVIDVPDIK